MKRWSSALSLMLLACACTSESPAADPDQSKAAPAAAGEPVQPESDESWVAFTPGAKAKDFAEVVKSGLDTPGKGPDHTHFVIIRAAERHVAGFDERAFHVIVGGGVKWPAGSMRVQRKWRSSGMIDGNNEQLQTNGVAVVIEAGTKRPYAPAVRDALAAFCLALMKQAHLHPDCVTSMAEIPYTRDHKAARDETALVHSVRRDLPLPKTHGKLTLRTQDGPIVVTYEKRTGNAIQVGMMLRRAFPGPNRGMLFVYPYASRRSFWMKNCRIPLDLAYVKRGKIRQILTMKPQWGAPHGELRFHESNSAVRYALEMPAGWFAKNGAKVGDAVIFE